MEINDFGGYEILQIVESVSRERSIPKESIFNALEDGLKVAAKRKYGGQHQIKAVIDRKTGSINLYKELLVVTDHAEVEFRFETDKIITISLEDAKLKDPSVNLGDIICEWLPAMDIGRIAAQLAKQVINFKIKEIERDLQYEEFKNHIGEIVSGTVEKVEGSNLIVRLSHSAEALLKRDNSLRSDHYRQGDRIRALLLTIDRNSTRSPYIILSRTHEDFVVALFKQEVPEIYDGVIQIRGIARDPGSRTKITVYSSDASIDAVGSCVGMRGARVQSVISELKGEKIDILPYSSDLGTLLVSALAPAEITKILIDEDVRKIEVMVPDESQSIAIGRQGQNVRLASKLVGYKIDIITEKEELRRRQDFMDSLGLDAMLAQLLASEGYNSVDSIYNADIEALESISGISPDVAIQLKERAIDYKQLHKTDDQDYSPNIEEIESNLLEIKGVTIDLAKKLENSGIKTIQDLADLSRDELKELVPDSNLNDDILNSIIMGARDKCYFNDSNS